MEPVYLPCSACGGAVQLTGAGRPRNHNRPRGGGPCTSPRDDYELPHCKYCGGDAYVPEDDCRSPLYHPEIWEYRGMKVGNAAAVGELVGVTGPHYQWLAKNPPAGPRRAPQHKGVRRDGVRFYSIREVREYTERRPGPGRWARRAYHVVR